MKRLFVLILTLVMLLGLAACHREDAPPTESTVHTAQPSTDTPDGTNIKTFTVGTTAQIEKAVRGEYAFDMLASGVSELPLIRQDTEGNFHPLLASFTTEDSQTWTFTVTEGLKWSDGAPVTAEDILYTLQYEDRTEGAANFVSQTDEGGKTTEARFSGYALSEDKMQLSLVLTTPNVRFLSTVTTLRILPMHLYFGKTDVTEAEARVTCGPYVLESFNHDAGTLTFRVNALYPQKPNVETIVYRIFGNEDTMYLALQHGDIDMVWNYSSGVAATYQEILAGLDTVKLMAVSATNAPAVLAFNNAKGLFADEKLRLAVSYALDYTAFGTYFGSANADLPNRGFVPGTTVGYKPTDKLEYNEAVAQDYMRAAGYTKNSAGFYEKEGKECAFVLTVNASKTTHVALAELVKTQLERFGIRVGLDAVDKDSYNAKTSNKFSQNNITMEAAIYGFTAAGMGMGSGLGSIYVDGSHNVQGGCQVFDDEFTAILGQMREATTPDAYSAAAGRLQDYYAAHCPLIALYWDQLILAYSSNYENLTADATFGLNCAANWFSITAKS